MTMEALGVCLVNKEFCLKKNKNPRLFLAILVDELGKDWGKVSR